MLDFLQSSQAENSSPVQEIPMGGSKSQDEHFANVVRRWGKLSQGSTSHSQGLRVAGAVLAYFSSSAHCVNQIVILTFVAICRSSVHRA